MKFTVIIPCFGASQTIARALGSLVRQTYTNFEVVLVEDASLDFKETLHVIEQFKSLLEIRLVRNSVNSNGAFSRNRGIEVARGDFVAFLDADDCWAETRLASAINIIDSLTDRNFVIYARFELIQLRPNGAILPLRAIKKNELVSEYVFAAGQSMQTSTFICPLEVAKDVLFDEKYSRHQDTDFMMRAQNKGIDLVYQNQKCSNYYITTSDIVSRVKTGRINGLFCETWLKDKSMFFNDKSYSGYKLIVYSRILYIENSVLKASLVVFWALPKIGFKNFVDLLKTKMHIISAKLFTVCLINSSLNISHSDFSYIYYI